MKVKIVLLVARILGLSIDINPSDWIKLAIKRVPAPSVSLGSQPYQSK